MDKMQYISRLKHTDYKSARVGADKVPNGKFGDVVSGTANAAQQQHAAEREIQELLKTIHQIHTVGFGVLSVCFKSK